VQKALSQVSDYKNPPPAWRRNAVTSLFKIIPGVFRLRAECLENILVTQTMEPILGLIVFIAIQNYDQINRTFCDEHLNVANVLTSIPEQI